MCVCVCGGGVKQGVKEGENEGVKAGSRCVKEGGGCQPTSPRLTRNPHIYFAAVSVRCTLPAQTILQKQTNRVMDCTHNTSTHPGGAEVARCLAGFPAQQPKTAARGPYAPVAGPPAPRHSTAGVTQPPAHHAPAACPAP